VTSCPPERPELSSGDEREPLALRDSIDAVVRSMRGTGARSLAGVFGGWDEAVGAQVAAHARPVSLVDGCLVVEVDHPGWATQLRFLETDVLQQLREVAGADEVRRIEVRVKGR
jgi:predicted nucleic acid-binding Zn ribbon protein